MIEYHVVSFELSRRLHDLGVKKGSLFWRGKGDYHDSKKEWILPFGDEENWTHDESYRSYTASEILEMLPDKLTINDKIFQHTKDFDFKFKIFRETYDNEGNKWWLVFYDLENMYCAEALCKLHLRKNDHSLQNALAKMLIYLIENNLVKVEEINK